MFDDLSLLDTSFVLAAFAGGLVVLFKTIMLIVAIDEHVGGSLDGSSFDHGGDHDGGFEFLSIQSIAAFFLMFGLVGLAISRGSMLGAVAAVIGGVAVGVGAMWILAKLFQLALRMQSSGTLAPERALGSSGKITLTIPTGGTGRAVVSVANRYREYDARELNGKEVQTGARVQVVLVEGSIVVVEVVD